MKTRIKYCFSRLIVLLVALHTLDVSVDIDHLTAFSPWYTIEKYDDIDSISEFIVETIFNDDHLVTESDSDDKHPSEKNITKFSTIILACTNFTEDFAIQQPLLSGASIKLASRDTKFRFEDHSFSDYNPPDSLAI